MNDSSRQGRIFLALTIVIGVLAGLSAVLFTLAIESTKDFLFGMEPSRLRLVLVPALVSLFTGFLLARFFPYARGSGVPQTKAAYHLEEGRIPASVPFAKFLTGALCVGAGHSLGREGPSVQIGAGIASMIGRRLDLSPEMVRDLVPVGAAAALAAAFNTPVAAVMFALEEIISDMNAGLIGSTVVAAVAAVMVERSLLGNEVLFRVPAYQLAHPAELLAYAGLGIAGGLISVCFCKGLLQARREFRRLPSWTLVFQPALGGLAVGAILIFFPQVMSVGYEYIDQALHGGLAWKALLILCFVKLAATILSYASGNAGGIFAPSLYLGAMAGGSIGMMIHRYAPFPTADSGAYALVGMGTLFAGIIRAPVTSVFMIFELTQGYQILVPLMVANMVSYMISKHYQPTPIYHALMEQDGVHIPQPGVLRVLQSKTETAAFYNKIAKVYDLLSEHSEEPVRRQGLEILAAHPGERVLEIGAGTGHCLASLARQDTRVFGIDLSEGMLRQARETCLGAQLARGDAAQLPFASGSMDALFMSFTLELFDTPEIPTVLAECRRVLRPGGRIVVVGMSKDGGRGIMVDAFEWTHRHFPNFLDCRPIYVRHALQEAGFDIRTSTIIPMWVPVEIVLALA